MPSFDSDRSDAARDGSRPAYPDGGAVALTEEQVYDAVNHAVRDALWDVLGTVVLSLFLLVLFAVGLQIVVAGITATSVVAVVPGTALAGVAALGFLRLFGFL